MNAFSIARGLPGLILGLSLLSGQLPAADWPHWLGPNGDNTAPASNSFNPDLGKWNIAWQTNVGLGFSSVAVANGRAVTLGHDGKTNETVFCLDAVSGQLIWKYSYEAQLMPVMHPGGPNATATFIGVRVITLSKDGQVFCFTTDRGDVRWRSDLVSVLGIKLPQWGFASSPVVLGHTVLFSAGKVAALDLATGKTVWTSREAYPPAYTTTVPFELDGPTYIAALDGKGLSILSAKDGAEIARHPFTSTYDLNASTPFVLEQGRKIFLSGNASSEMLGFDGQNLISLWTTTEMKNSMNNSVIVGDNLYGIDGRQNDDNSRLVSIALNGGRLNWARAAFGFGNTIGVGDIILAMNESGELVTIRPSPQGYDEISRLQVLGKLCWTTPTFAGKRIYVRNDKGDVACLAPPR